MTDLAGSSILWLLGSLFVLAVFEPAEDTPPRNLLMLAMFWPFYTIVLVFQDIFYKEEE